MTESSTMLALCAASTCFAEIARLVKARQPDPVWQPHNPPNMQLLRKTVRQVAPRLEQAFSELDDCIPAARKELRKARGLMITKGVSVRQKPVRALGESAEFALDIAYKKIEQNVECVDDALSASDNLDRLLRFVNRLDDFSGRKWSDFCAHLDQEVHDAEAILSKAPLVGEASRGNVKPPAGKKPSVNARMLETIQQNIDSTGWSSGKWAKHLRCVKSSVVATQAWKNFAIGRDREKAQRAQDRRRRPKASDLNRD